MKFWIDTFKSKKRAVHNSIRSQVMNDVIEALIANGFSLPASIVELKNYEPYGNLKLGVEKEIIKEENDPADLEEKTNRIIRK